MVTLNTVDTNDAIQKIVEETGLEKEIIDQRIKEIIEKYSGMLTEQGALVLLSKELRVKNPLFEGKSQSYSLGEIKEGMNNIDVKATAEIVDRLKTFNKNGKEGKYVSVRLIDKTGDALFTFWNDQAEEVLQKGLQGGSELVFTNLKAGTFNNKVQLSMGYNSTYTIDNSNVVPATPSATGGTTTPAPKEIPFGELKENEYVSRKAHIVDVLPGKGYYAKCSKCNEKVQDIVENCPSCQAEKSVDIRLLLPILLDDGTKPLRGVAFEEQVLQITGKTKEEMMDMLKDPAKKEEMEKELLGKVIQVEGKTKTGMDRTSIEILIRKGEQIPFNS